MPKKIPSQTKTSGTVSNGSKSSSKPVEAQVDQIRDIIFGSQMEKYERRFLDLEDRLGRDADSLRADVAERLERIESTLLSQLQADRAERLTATEQQTEAIREVSERIGTTATDLGAQTVKIKDALSQRLETESRNFQGELAKVRGELLKIIEDRAAHLSKTKADRAVIAKLFSTAAAKLTDEQSADSPQAKRTSRR